MPKNINYTPIFNLVSQPRLSRFDVFFSDIEDKDYKRFGIYLWSQHASASLYPLMQHLEVLLRNSIDREARRRFGDYWWDFVNVDTTKTNHNNFKNGIRIALRNLEKAWKKAEKIKLGISQNDSLPATSQVPNFSHDDIVAATDFGTWKEVLISAYHTSNLADQDDFLWPKSISKVFRKYNAFDNSPNKAREEILNVVNELKDYRNRLFHHDCIWVKSKSTNSQNAIETIRHKINVIEKLIMSISPVTTNTLSTWGVFSHAKRICSTHELKLYINMEPEFSLEENEPEKIHEHFNASTTLNKTVPFSFKGKALGTYALR
ncbi:hypothetical protein WNY63_06050 [Pseudoalteromonas neustonica]|uniref:Abi family protein n=1 Tax=Pseudoalteromonas neustonica TaxID=1840331 RepID=A0ABU9U176_9GAMM